MASAREYGNWSSLFLQLYLLKISEQKTLNYELYLYNYKYSYIYKLASKEVAPGVCALPLLCLRHFYLPCVLQFYSTIAPFATWFSCDEVATTAESPAPLSQLQSYCQILSQIICFPFWFPSFSLLRCCQCSSYCRRAHPGIFPKQMWAGAAIKHALHILLEQADICLAI